MQTESDEIGAPSLRDGSSRRRLAEAELAELSYAVSHDMSAVARHIFEFSRLLVNDIGGQLTADQQQDFARLEAEHQRCEAMIEQILSFSRIQSRPLNLRPLGVDKILQKVLLSLGRKLGAAHAELDVSPLGDVIADGELLEIALHHLVDHAVGNQAQPPRLRFSSAADAAGWTLTFEAWGGRTWASDGASDGAAEPSTLAGLAVCRRIARRHGGDLELIDLAGCARAELFIPHAAGADIPAGDA